MSTQIHNKTGYGNVYKVCSIFVYLFHFCLQYTALMFATIAGQSELAPDYNSKIHFLKPITHRSQGHCIAVASCWG